MNWNNGDPDFPSETSFLGSSGIKSEECYTRKQSSSIAIQQNKNFSPSVLQVPFKSMGKHCVTNEGRKELIIPTTSYFVFPKTLQIVS